MKPEKLFAAINEFVGESRALLDSGKLMELKGLDERVKTLCAAVLELTQEERTRYADKLQTLLNDLTVLGTEMAAQRDQVGKEISHLSDHKKASVAYRTTEAIDKSGESE